jgi:Winged helix-turn helix
VPGVTVRLMSDGELTRLEVLRDLDQKRLTTEAAGQLLALERRQVFRLLKAYRTAGPAGLISKRRGRRSNRRKPEAVRSEAPSIIREHSGISGRHFGGREVARGSWDNARPRDAAIMDDRRWDLG